LELAKQSNNQPAIADAYFEFGQLRLDEEKYPLALQEYDKALDIYKSVEISFALPLLIPIALGSWCDWAVTRKQSN
jgi:tetratricopeptide (TPR) repeat protein